MIDLAEFLLARIAEDEQAATWLNRWRLDHPDVHERWRVERENETYRVLSSPTPGHITDETVMTADALTGKFVVDHIVRWDPARVLAECDAKRRLIREHVPWPVDGGNGEQWDRCLAHEWQRYPCGLLKIVALPYAEHPEYRDEWRPA